jgi:hypothetical protein
MKTTAVFAATLACASNALAQTEEQWYNLVASAPGKPIHGKPLKPLERHWHIGIQSNSSCGDATPAVTVVDQAMPLYNDGKSNQQYGKFIQETT